MCEHVCWAQIVLTFRKVALSLVTMDGLTLMLSCIIDVKLQNKTKRQEEKLVKTATQTKTKHKKSPLQKSQNHCSTLVLLKVDIKS